MRLVLVNPCWARTRPPLPGNLAELAGYIRDVVDAQVDVCDLNVELARFPLNQLLAGAVTAIAGRRPDVVGITCNTVHVPFVVPLVRRLHQELPGVRVVLGGVHASFRPLELLSLSGADYAVCGEGELRLAGLLGHIAGDGPLPPGVWAGCGGTPRCGTGRLEPVDLGHSPPPAYDLLPMKAYCSPGNVGPAITASRGCPFNCLFCGERAMWGRYRPKPARRVAQELETLQHNGARAFMFGDDCFTTDGSHTGQLLRVAEPLGMEWTCLARIDQVGPTLAGRLRRAGCSSLYHGIESGSPRLRQVLNKRYSSRLTNEAVVASVASELDAGLKVTCSFMVGIPTEQPADREATLTLAANLRQAGAQVQLWILTPYPGAPVTRDFAGDLVPVDRWDLGHTYDVFGPEQHSLYDGLMPEVAPENPDRFMFRPQPDIPSFFAFYRQAWEELGLPDPATNVLLPYRDEVSTPARLHDPAGAIDLDENGDGWRWVAVDCDGEAAWESVTARRCVLLSLRCATTQGALRAAPVLRRLADARTPVVRLTRPLPSALIAELGRSLGARLQAPRGCADCLELIHRDREGTLRFCSGQRASLTYVGNRLQLASRRRQAGPTCSVPVSGGQEV